MKSFSVGVDTWVSKNHTPVVKFLDTNDLITGAYFIENKRIDDLAWLLHPYVGTIYPKTKT